MAYRQKRTLSEPSRESNELNATIEAQPNGPKVGQYATNTVINTYIEGKPKYRTFIRFYGDINYYCYNINDYADNLICEPNHATNNGDINYIQLCIQSNLVNSKS